MAEQVNPITLEVLRNAFVAIAEEMGATLQRASYSTNIKTRLDFSCGIVDANLDLVAQAFHQPGHLGSLSSIAARALREYGVENLRPGDGILINDPYRGGTHLPDVTLISPLFVGGQLVCCMVSLAHHADVGGKSPGSVPADATEVWQEGLIIPPIPVVENDQINPHMLKFIAANVRTPEERLGDFRAQIAANLTGKRRMERLIERYGLETVTFYMRQVLDYSETRTRAALARLPDGVYTAEDWMDSDGITDDPLRIAVRVTIENDEIVADFTGTSPQGRGPCNGRYATTLSGVVFSLKSLMGEDIMTNQGFYRPITVIAPEGTVVNSRHPAPVGGTWETCMRVCDVMFKALAPIFPDRVAAAPKGIIGNLTYGGIDPRRGRTYAYYETVAGGFGGRKGKNGLDGVQCHFQNTPNSPVEELEIALPVLIQRYEFRPDSEGAGQWRGGLGLRRDFWFYDHEATFSVLTDRARFAPYGLFGGQDGATSYFAILEQGKPVRSLPAKSLVILQPHQTFTVQTPGGGGYGDPLDHDPEALLRDVRDGKISPERARRVYGVVIDTAAWAVDHAATSRLRAEMRRAPRGTRE